MKVTIRKNSIAVLAASLLMASLASQAKAFTSYGGEASCGTVAQKQDESGYAALYMAWMFGFITAANELTETTYKNPPDQNGIWQALILHCENNPLDNLYDATANVWGQLLLRNQR